MIPKSLSPNIRPPRLQRATPPLALKLGLSRVVWHILLLHTCWIRDGVLVSLCLAFSLYADLLGGSSSHDVAPGQALLRQLHMSQSPQRAQQQQQQQWQSQANSGAAASGWDVYPTQSASPFFDPAIVSASSAALREAGDSAYVSAYQCSGPKWMSCASTYMALEGLPAMAGFHQESLTLAMSAYMHSHSAPKCT